MLGSVHANEHGTVLQSLILGMYLQVSWELTWEPAIEQAGSGSSNSIGSVRGVYLGAS